MSATAGNIGPGSGYRDYVGNDPSPQNDFKPIDPGAERVIGPREGVMVVEAPAKLREQASTKKPAAVPMRPVSPTRLKSAATIAATTSTTVCNYQPNILTGNPPPPASGASFAVAKAINGAPYSRAGKNAGIFQGGQARALQDGVGNFTTSRTSTAETGISLYIGSGWPAGSSIQFWFNPILRGRGSTASATSPLYSQSTGSVQERIDSGAGFSTEVSYQNMWDLSHTNSSGVAQTTPTWVWNGLANGGFYYRQVPVSAVGYYKFSLRSVTTASATSVYGAGASATMDFGSGILSTPAELSPYNFYVMPNASTATGQPYSHVTIAYVLPSGWGISC
jgi:hypothetical protein